MKIRLLALLLFVTATVASVHSNVKQLQTAQSAALAKVAPWVIEHTQDGKQAEFLVVLADHADLKGAALLKTKREKGRFVYEALWSKARETQQSMLSWLEAGKIEHRSHYIVNMIWVNGDSNVALALAARPETARVEGNPRIKADIERPLPVQPRSPGEVRAEEVQTVEGNINNTRAPEVWALGYTGQGVVIAGADTGYRWDHDALKPHYRGWNGSIANHDFNWHDSIHVNNTDCAADSPQPCDDDGHGTHTVGTAIGDDGSGNQIGMAPGAKWIGCRNMNDGNGTPATYIECMEFFLAPYPLNGTPAQGDPDKAPDITTNSWACPSSEGCMPGTLQQAVEAQRAAGIMMVVAAGNNGPGCSTVFQPPGHYDAAYSVGAFDHVTNVIASFSSRGPVTVDGSNRLKPDITAPGVGVRSASRGDTNTFFNLSGTSMATPHVAGAVALLWSAQPALRGHVAFAEQILNNAAVHVSSTSCSSNGVPNNVYGYGRLDIKSAVDAALPCTSVPTLSKSSEAFSASPGAGSLDVISVSACGWIAQSNASWIIISSGTSGVGNGSVGYSVAANNSTNPRSGTLVIGGQTFTVLQGAAFLDVPADHVFYTAIGKVSARGITVGCNSTNYCPDSPTTREQMSAFIVRALGDFNPPMPAQQRFGDVPPSNGFYNFIEELAVRQITVGCGGGNYCPTALVLRDQMSAFIMRALGEPNPPMPAMQRFADVPPSNPFYNFIDRMAVLQITLGCGGANYCPHDPVTRGQMAAFLVRAFDL
jgi:serine protease AprX